MSIMGSSEIKAVVRQLMSDFRSLQFRLPVNEKYLSKSEYRAVSKILMMTFIALIAGI